MILSMIWRRRRFPNWHEGLGIAKSFDKDFHFGPKDSCNFQNLTCLHLFVQRCTKFDGGMKACDGRTRKTDRTPRFSS